MLFRSLSFGAEGVFELLEACDTIYMPVASDETARAKLWQYREAIKLLELEEILEKTKEIAFPSIEQLEGYAKTEGKRWSKN